MDFTRYLSNSYVVFSEAELPRNRACVLINFHLTRTEIPVVKTYKGVIHHFNDAPDDVKDYFPNFVELVENYPWDVSVSYFFSRIEQAKHMVIYCGIVKLHWCESTLTRTMVDKEHMSRGRFKELYKTVFGKNIKSEIIIKLENGEKARDKIAHGKNWTEKEVREGLVSAIDFASEFNDFVQEDAGFRPFGSLKGFKGRAESLPKSTTRWVLQGMGIPKQSANK